MFTCLYAKKDREVVQTTDQTAPSEAILGTWHFATIAGRFGQSLLETQAMDFLLLRFFWHFGKNIPRLTEAIAKGKRQENVVKGGREIQEKSLVTLDSMKRGGKSVV